MFKDWDEMTEAEQEAVNDEAFGEAVYWIEEARRNLGQDADRDDVVAFAAAGLQRKLDAYVADVSAMRRALRLKRTSKRRRAEIADAMPGARSAIRLYDLALDVVADAAS